MPTSSLQDVFFFGIVPLTACTLDSFWCCVLVNSEYETVNVDGKNSCGRGFFLFVFFNIYMTQFPAESDPPTDHLPPPLTVFSASSRMAVALDTSVYCSC